MKPSTAPKKNAQKRDTSRTSFLRRLLYGQLRLRGGRDGLRVTWGETLMQQRQTPAPDKAGPVSTPASSDERTLVLSELGILLSANPKNRQVLRHLVFFESAFARKGYECLDDLPVKPLRKAHDQLQLLASTWSSRVLESLVARMATALIRRGGDADSSLRAALTAHKQPVVVNEGSLSDFFLLDGERFTELGRAS